MTDFFQYLPVILSGLSVTMGLTVASVFFGAILALLFTMGSMSDVAVVKKIVSLFTFAIRGTPLLVQIYLIYYGLGQFAWIRESFLWFVLREPAFCAVTALSINSACYTAVILQGAIRSIPENEKTACLAMGMHKWLAFRRIILPRAFRIALPAYSNEVAMILKGTSLASTITLLDLMGVTQSLIADTYQTVPFYLIAAFCYLSLNGLISVIFYLMPRLMRVCRPSAA